MSNIKRFQYLRPTTLNEALILLKKYKGRARALMGGTDLMVRIQKGLIDIDAVVDLQRVSNISSIVEMDNNIVNIGSKVVLVDLSENNIIRKYYPALVDAINTVGSVQIRNRATLTGNICNASPAADTVPALLVYGSSVVLGGAGGTRVVPLKDFFLGPGATVCKRTELVVSVQIPVPELPYAAAFARLTRRKGVDLATINLACGIDANRTTTIAFGAAGPTPIVAADKSGVLADINSSSQSRDEILRNLIRKTKPISDIRAGRKYREAMLLTLGRRVLHQAQQQYDQGMVQ
jgi:carbon-monoxide dehydrogenase medium subunit